MDDNDRLRVVSLLYRDAIEEAIKSLGEFNVVAKKLNKVLKSARYNPVPCRRCHRMLKNHFQ